MAYNFYLGSTLLPVTPESLNVKINGNNKKYTLINESEINVLKSAGLTDIDFDMMLPNVKHPFAVYDGGFKTAEYYLGLLESLKGSKSSFQFIVTRTLPGGTALVGTNITVSLESYTIKEDAKNNGLDMVVSVKLKQYREYATKVVAVTISKKKKTRAVEDAAVPTSGGAQSYTVKKGDCLWNIAKKYYGSGSKYNTIYNANKSVIGGNPNLIYPGQVLTIPAS
jgi:LysM repeat protein